MLDKYVEDEEICISELCVKNKPQAYENLKAERNHFAEEWNRLTEEREKQIRADAIDEFVIAYITDEEQYDGCKDCQRMDDYCCIQCFRNRFLEKLKEQNNG